MAVTANSVVIVAEAEGRLLGHVEAEGGRFLRNRITAQIVIAILAAVSGRSVGSGLRLLGELERWAATTGLHRLELTVMAHSDRAIRL